MSGRRFDHRREMVPLVTPHRTHDRDVIDHATDIRKPIGDRGAGLPITREGAVASNDRALHLCQVVAETDGVDEFTHVLVAFRIKGVEVTYTPTHEEEDDRLRFGFSMRMEQRVLDLSYLSKEATQRGAEEPATSLMQKAAPRIT